VQGDFLHGTARRLSGKTRSLSVVDSGTTTNQNEKVNDFWSEWQDLNLRPLRPERSALPG
jgi:hypothetical protein